MNILQLGNYGDDAGGISSVLREFQSWQWPAARQAFIDTYASDPRLFGVRRFAAAMSSLLRNRRRIDVVHVHLSERGSFVREGALVMVAAMLRIRTVVTLHGADFVEFADQHAWLVRMVLRRADQITVLTEATAQVLDGLGLQDVTRIPNAVSAGADGAESATFADRRDVVYAGVVARRKGADVLFEAWPDVATHHPDARLQVYGEVTDVDMLDGDSVHVHGKVPREVVRQAVRRARVVVLPSRAEAFPMTILEAMSAGVPVVATSVGQISEMLGDMSQVVPVGDASRLSAAIQSFLADHERAAGVGRRNLERYREYYSPEVVMAQYERLYGS